MWTSSPLVVYVHPERMVIPVTCGQVVLLVVLCGQAVLLLCGQAVLLVVDPGGPLVGGQAVLLVLLCGQVVLLVVYVQA